MTEEEGYSGDQYFTDIVVKIKDLEEKNRILKERVLLIGQNLIEIKEHTNEKLLDMKKDIEELKTNLDRTRVFIETISKEFSRFARKDDLDILIKQAKMFQPLLSSKQKQEDLEQKE